MKLHKHDIRLPLLEGNLFSKVYYLLFLYEHVGSFPRVAVHMKALVLLQGLI